MPAGPAPSPRQLSKNRTSDTRIFTPWATASSTAACASATLPESMQTSRRSAPGAMSATTSAVSVPCWRSMAAAEALYARLKGLLQNERVVRRVPDGRSPDACDAVYDTKFVSTMPTFTPAPVRPAACQAGAPTRPTPCDVNNPVFGATPAGGRAAAHLDRGEAGGPFRERARIIDRIVGPRRDRPQQGRRGHHRQCRGRARATAPMQTPHPRVPSPGPHRRRRCARTPVCDSAHRDGHEADHRCGEGLPAGRTEERGVTEGKDPTVTGHQPIAVGGRASPPCPRSGGSG